MTRTKKERREAALASVSASVNKTNPPDEFGSVVRRRGTVIHVVDELTYEGEAPAPAWYEPATGDIYVHLTESDIRFETDNSKGGKFAGLIAHESSHTLHSNWMTQATNDLRMTEPALLGTMTLLEEVRIEKLAIDNRAGVRTRLRASLEIILKSVDLSDGSPGTVLFAWILVVGRVAAGVAEFEEVQSVDSVARTILGDVVVDAISDLVQEASMADGDDALIYADVMAIAREIHELVPPSKSATTSCAHGAGTPGHASGSGTPGGGSGTGTSSEEKPDEKPDEKVDEGAGGGSNDEPEDEPEDESKDKPGKGDEEDDAADKDEDEDGDEDSVGGHGFSEDDAEMVRRAIRKTVEDIVAHPDRTREVQLGDPAAWASKVFGRTKASAHPPTQWRVREPSQSERRAVTSLARQLETLTLPSISKRPVNKELPPGRLKTREAVRASAERSQGKMVTATPWRSTKRRHTHVKPLIVGLMTDTSGSMNWAQYGVAVAAYVVSNAGARVGARTASVTFGSSVYPVTWPREPATSVIARTTGDGWEQFDGAAAALDGALKLSSTEASKLVVIVTDGQLVADGQSEKARRWTDRWAAAGVSMIWIGATGGVIKRLAPTAVTATISGVDDDLAITRAIETAIGRMAAQGVR